MSKEKKKESAHAFIRELSEDECKEMLARHSVGRLAFSLHDHVDIEPINYVYDDGWIYGRTSPGSKIASIHHNRWVAFEIDEMRGVLDWESVVVQGTFYPLTPGGPDYLSEVRDRALKLVQKLIPESGTEDDPVPFRSILFRISVNKMTGRLATPPNQLA